MNLVINRRQRETDANEPKKKKQKKKKKKGGASIGSSRGRPPSRDPGQIEKVIHELAGASISMMIRTRGTRRVDRSMRASMPPGMAFRRAKMWETGADGLSFQLVGRLGVGARAFGCSYIGAIGLACSVGQPRSAALIFVVEINRRMKWKIEYSQRCAF